MHYNLGNRCLVTQETAEMLYSRGVNVIITSDQDPEGCLFIHNTDGGTLQEIVDVTYVNETNIGYFAVGGITRRQGETFVNKTISART